MKISRVTLKSVSNCFQVHINLIIGLRSVDNFSYTNLILSVSLWSWWPHLCVTIKNVGGNLLCCSSFNDWINLQIEGWCSTINSWNLLCPPSTVLFVLWSPLSTDYKHSSFLAEILELLVFFCFCYTFHGHTLSQHNPWCHLNFLLLSRQCTHKFHLHLPKAQIKVQTTWMHTYRCYFPLSNTCVRPKEDIFRHSDCEKWNKHPVTVHLVGVVKSHSYLQSQNSSCTMTCSCWGFFRVQVKVLPHIYTSVSFHFFIVKCKSMA